MPQKKSNLDPMHPRVKPTVFVISIFILGLLFGTIFEKVYFNKVSDPVERHELGYKYISPLLDCDIYKEISSDALEPFRDKIVNYLDENNLQDSTAIYFQDLQSGYWLGLKERDDFILASLAKVPLLIAYYRITENDPDLAKTIIAYHDEFDGDQNIDDASEVLVPGNEYLVEDLANRMIKYSDNESQKVVQRFVEENNPGLLEQVYALLGMKKGEEATLKSYSSAFRILYNASYLSNDYSEKALALLSKSDFKRGLVSGVPEDVMVSHKFGYFKSDFSTAIQFTHCGIVYVPKRPYLLCVNTRSEDARMLENRIDQVQEISKMVYEEVTAQLGL